MTSEQEQYNKWLESDGLEDSHERYEEWLAEVWQGEYEDAMQSQWEQKHTLEQ